MAERASEEPPRRRRGDEETTVTVTPPAPRNWWSLRKGARGLLAVLTVAAGLAVVGLLAVHVLTDTDWGRERVRRYVIRQFEQNTNGRLRIGSLDGNLREGFVARGVAITERNGAPFVAADSLKLRYVLRNFFSKRIAVDDVTLWRPVVVLDQPPEGDWNFERIFPGKDVDVPRDTTPGFGDWLHATDVRIVDGDVVVRTPWKVDETAPRAEQRRDVAEALSGRERTVVVRHPQGFQKVMRFRRVNAQLPRAILADPRIDWRTFEVATANLVAMPFHPPHAEVRDLKGTFRLDGDSLWWKDARGAFPGSQLVASGRYWFRGDDAWVRGQGDRIALADFRWAYPRLPAQGGGPTRFEYRMNDAFMTFRAREMDVRIGSQRAQGAVGVTFHDVGDGDTVIVHDTRLTATRVDTRLLEQLLDFESPRRGTITGPVTIAGGLHHLRVNGDVTFDEVRSGRSRFVGGGLVAFVDEAPGRESDIRVRDMRLRLLPMQVALIQQDFPDVPMGGTVSGTVVVNGSVNEGGTAVGDIVHVDRGERSGFSGRITALYATEPIRFDVDGRVHPLALATAGRFAPELGLRGYATGPVKLRGTFDDLSLDVDLGLANAGHLAARGRVTFGRVPSYDIAARMRALDIGAVLANQPRTSLTGTVLADGRGVTPEQLEGTYVVDLRGSRWDTLAVDSAVGRVRVANGLLGIDRLAIGARGASLVADGSFGMRAGRVGTLTYRVSVPDLATVAPLVPGLAGDTGRVRPRPGLLAERVRQARADSARIARATEIERIVTGRPMPRIAVDTPRAVPKGVVGGSLVTAGTARGWVRDFDLRGRAAAEHVIAKGSAARSLRAEYAWTNARTARSALALGVDADGVSAAGFAFDTVSARIAYGANRAGRVELVARQGTDRDYAVRGNFVFHPDHNELHVSDAAFRFDTTRYTLAQPAAVQWGPRGVAVRNVDLRGGPSSRIWVNGLLPTEGQANLDVATDNLDLAHVASITQSDLDVAGHLTLRGHMSGTLRSPVFRGSFGVPDATYGGTVVPQLRGTFAYANRSLDTRVLAMRADTTLPIAVVDATVPMNLALSGVQGDRFSGEGLRVDVTADSLPLDLAPRFTDVVRDVKGFAAGRVALRGALDRPALTGAIVVRDAEATIAANGVRVTDVNGAVRMLGDTVRIDSLVGRAGGELRLTGGLAVGNWREPTFDLHLVANEAMVLDDDRGELRADAALALTGPFRNSYLAGQVRITDGVVYVPETRDVENIAPGDPTLFAVLDTAIMAERELLPAEDPLFDNLRVDVDLQVDRGTWVRTRDANIEVFSDGLVHVHRSRLGNARAALALTGVLGTDRGEYRVFSKRFQVKRGSAVFIGSPEINPTVQATAEYQAQPAGREAVTIRVVLGGTLQSPRLALESDAQPPLSQSDILSFLAFGKETSSLLEFEGSPLSSRSGNPNLAGVGKTAGRRLASVALGLAVDELEGDAGRDLGVDVIDITPEDVPIDFGGNAVQEFLLGTRLELGKYVTPTTFVSVFGSPSVLTGRGQAKAPPGARLEYRTSKGWRFDTSLEPRLRLREPSLTEDPSLVAPISVFGLFLFREWRF